MTGDGTADMMRIVCEATCEKGQPARAQSRMRNHAQKGPIRSRTKQASQASGSLKEIFERWICMPSAIMTTATRAAAQFWRMGHMNVLDRSMLMDFTANAAVSV